jgi:hypothetical protein
VAYRSTNQFRRHHSASFSYDDNLNHAQASFGAHSTQPVTADSYAIDKANEYTQLTRNG